MGLEDIKQVAVIGAGNMGAGIAEVLSRVGGYHVVMSDATEELAKAGLQRQQSNLQKYFVDKGKITGDEMKAIIGRIKTTAKLFLEVKLLFLRNNMVFLMNFPSYICKNWGYHFPEVTICLPCRTGKLLCLQNYSI